MKLAAASGKSSKPPVTIRDLCAQLAREFRAQPGQIEADVLAFLNQMSAEKLVNVLPG